MDPYQQEASTTLEQGARQGLMLNRKLRLSLKKFCAIINDGQGIFYLVFLYLSSEDSYDLQWSRAPKTRTPTTKKKIGIRRRMTITQICSRRAPTPFRSTSSSWQLWECWKFFSLLEQLSTFQGTPQAHLSHAKALCMPAKFFIESDNRWIQ